MVQSFYLYKKPYSNVWDIRLVYNKGSTNARKSVRTEARVRTPTADARPR
jgi:hypothetical protein